jgi:hypothetical protein
MSRTLFAAGYLPPLSPVCRDGRHVGYPMGAGRILAWCEAHPESADLWRGMATCSACRSTVHLSAFRRAA